MCVYNLRVRVKIRVSCGFSSPDRSRFSKSVLLLLGGFLIIYQIHILQRQLFVGQQVCGARERQGHTVNVFLTQPAILRAALPIEEHLLYVHLRVHAEHCRWHRDTIIQIARAQGDHLKSFRRWC